MMLDLPDEDVDFILGVLRTQPLPFIKVEPILSRIGGQIMALHAQRNAPPAEPPPPIE